MDLPGCRVLEKCGVMGADRARKGEFAESGEDLAATLCAVLPGQEGGPF